MVYSYAEIETNIELKIDLWIEGQKSSPMPECSLSRVNKKYFLIKLVSLYEALMLHTKSKKQ